VAHSLRRFLQTVAVASALLLAGCIPPFVYPHVNTSSFDTAFILPAPSEAPWLRLDNGLDLYAWQNCYVYVLRRDPCDGMSLIAVPSGATVDWMRLFKSQHPDAVVSDRRVDVVRPLSAHSGTPDRLIGLFRRYEGSPAKDDDILLGRQDSIDTYNLAARGAVPVALRHSDIWHDMTASGAQTGDIQLVVYDDQRTWIFAQPVGTQDTANLYAPVRLFHFDGAASELLQRPMVLYFDDGASRGQARRVVADDEAAAIGYRIAFANMPLPQAIFTLDTNTFQRPVVRQRQPTLLCHYSESEFHASMFDDYQRRLPELKNCAPFTEAALRKIEQQRKH
jgi:hypothetical protein